MLFIEYDVTSDGAIEVVALINAIEEEGEDPGGETWLAWRAGYDDEGMGCAAVPAEDLALMEKTTDPGSLQAIVERVILADRSDKEAVES